MGVETTTIAVGSTDAGPGAGVEKRVAVSAKLQASVLSASSPKTIQIGVFFCISSDNISPYGPSLVAGHSSLAAREFDPTSFYRIQRSESRYSADKQKTIRRSHDRGSSQETSFRTRFTGMFFGMSERNLAGAICTRLEVITYQL